MKESLIISNDNRARVVQVLECEMRDYGETPRLGVYWASCGIPAGWKGMHWCGGLTLWALHEAGLALNWEWEIGKGYLYRLPMTRDPKPGDILYQHKPWQHHATVSGPVVDGMVPSIDGNQGFPGIQARIRRMRPALTFYSIEPLLVEASNRSAGL